MSSLTYPGDGRFDRYSPALVHILQEIFAFTDTGARPRLMDLIDESGITNMYGFLQAHAADATYSDRTVCYPHGTATEIPRSHVTKIETIQLYHHKYGFIEDDDSMWMSFSLREYIAFRNTGMSRNDYIVFRTTGVRPTFRNTPLPSALEQQHTSAIGQVSTRSSRRHNPHVERGAQPDFAPSCDALRTQSTTGHADDAADPTTRRYNSTNVPVSVCVEEQLDSGNLQDSSSPSDHPSLKPTTTPAVTQGSVPASWIL